MTSTLAIVDPTAEVVVTRGTVATIRVYDRKRWVSARALIDDSSNGLVVVTCDGKAWTYNWPRDHRGADGDDLARWLSRCHIGYVAGKFKADEKPNWRATAESCIREVFGARRSGTLTRDAARDLYDAAADIGDESSWHGWISDAAREGLCDLYETYCDQVEPEFATAWELLLPELRKGLTP